MLLSKKIIENIKPAFDKLQDDKVIRSYNVLLNLNMQITVFVEVDECLGIQYYFENISALKGYEGLVRIEEREYEPFALDEIEDPEVRALFEEDKYSTSAFRIRRRFDLIQEEHKELLNNWNPPCPIVTFYSYKGGVGRSTTLAAYASYLAMRHNKKVIILDCDLEAPGFTNYYDMDLGEGGEKEKEGIAEYMLDRMTNQFVYNSEPLFKQITGTISKYSYQIKSSFAQTEGGSGEIHVMTAGNLSNLDDFIEALARLDLSSAESIVNQFKLLFDDLKLAFNLDQDSVILIDSRTGFNDTFGVLSLFSPTIVGFFGTNIQSQYGLKFFLDKFSRINSEKNVLVVQAHNTPKGGRLAEQVIRYKEANASDFEGEHGFGITYEMPKIEALSILGENGEEASDAFMHIVNKIIGSGIFPRLDELFNAITASVEKKKSDYFSVKQPFIEEVSSIPNSVSSSVVDEERFSDALIDSWEGQELSHQSLIELKNKLLDELNDKYPQWYAEDESEINRINAKTVYYRSKLKDFFNPRYLVIVGSKGTGKTFLYESFKNKSIVRELCNIADKQINHYIFVNIIGLHDSKKPGYIEIGNFTGQHELINDAQYRRFWQVYVCNQLLQNTEVKKICSKHFTGTLYEPIDIYNNETTAKKLYYHIQSDEQFLIVEKTLNQIEKGLAAENKIAFILFDQLEFVVPIDKWEQGVAPLFKFWIGSSFGQIAAKFFMRSDLYEHSLRGFANKNSIKTIGIEWGKDEIFAYFFKHLLQISEKIKISFFRIIYAYWIKYWTHTTIKKYLSNLNAEHEYYQIPTDREQLEPLVETFFGQYANYNDSFDPRFGHKAYDWFETNLRDANKQVSLRPFWGLIEAAIKMYKEQETIELNNKRFSLYERVGSLEKERMKKHRQEPFPLLPATFYAQKTVREIAIHRYFDDLKKDAGNKNLDAFYKFMTESRDLPVKRQYSYRISEFEKLITAFGEAYPNIYEDMQKTSSEDHKKGFFSKMSDFLAHNGIIERLDFVQGRYTNYRFPYLYRGYFKLQPVNDHY